MDFDFKVPCAIPQDLLLIQDLIGTVPPPVTTNHAPHSPSPSDSIASTDDEVDSEDEVEADLVPCDEDNRMSASPDPALHSDSDSDASSSDLEEGHDHDPPPLQGTADDIGDEESSMTVAATYLQTKNEVVDANIIIPAISEIELDDKLEKVGEIMSVVGNIVIVKGLPVDHVRSLSEHALDVESLLVFDDRKVLGYVYETFGPTSQPLYQVRFSQHYPLDSSKVWLSREVFHVPQRSNFVFVDQLRKLRGSDASNIYDEEPADDEIEFSDDEKEAAFKAQRKRRGHSVSSSRQPTPAPPRIYADDMTRDTYRGSNPYEAHGPYDDDYHVTGSSRPSPMPYDDPYADVPGSDLQVNSTEPLGGFGGEQNSKNSKDGRNPRGHVFNRGTRGSGARNRQSWNTSRRGYRNTSTSRRTFIGSPDTNQSETSRVPIGDRQNEGAIGSYPIVQSASNAWFPPDTNHIPNYQQPLIQPHINPRFASMFGLNVPYAPIIPWASQNEYDHESHPHHWVDTWSMHSNVGSEAEGDTYRPM